ncbi:MAG: hypothetical protein ABSF46_02160 [Terriglobia bacterium]|jgi:hypothetical protein
MARDFKLLRSQIASVLASRFPDPFNYRNTKRGETVPTRNSETDCLTGGLPRGAITEICGPSGSGRTSLMLSALALRTAEGEACAFIDAHNTFDPYSAEATGVQLRQLLWVRCAGIDQAFRATDLVLHAGGFGLVALDLGDIPPETVRCIPLYVWFRFRRAVEQTPTIFLVLEQEPHAKSCASLVVQMETGTAQWLEAAQNHPGIPGDPRARLFWGSRLKAKVVCSRTR